MLFVCFGLYWSSITARNGYCYFVNLPYGFAKNFITLYLLLVGLGLKVRFSVNGRTRISYKCISFYPD